MRIRVHRSTRNVHEFWIGGRWHMDNLHSSAYWHMLGVLRLGYRHIYAVVFQCHSSETHQGCSGETCPVRVPRHSYQSHDSGEARGGAPPCAHPDTDFGLPHCGMPPVHHLCLCWGQLIQSLCGLFGQSKPGVRWWGGAFASGWDTGQTSILWTGVTLAYLILYIDSQMWGLLILVMQAIMTLFWDIFREHILLYYWLSVYGSKPQSLVLLFYWFCLWMCYQSTLGSVVETVAKTWKLSWDFEYFLKSINNNDTAITIFYFLTQIV